MEERDVEIDVNVNVEEKYPKSNDEIINKPNIHDEEAETEPGEIPKIIQKKFDYLINTEEDPIEFSLTDMNGIYENEEEYKYGICILLSDNSNDNCLLLEQTIKGIISNYGDLSTIRIEPKDIYIFIFINQRVNEEYLVSKNSIKHSKNNFYKICVKPKDENRQIKIDVIYKKYVMTDIESLQCFYNILFKLKKFDKYIISSVITAGIVPNNDCLKKLIITSLTSKNKNQKNNSNIFAIAVPSLEIKDDKNIFTKIAQYERTHFNLYDMSFYDTTGAIPISSLLNTMIMDNNLMNELKSYYGQIKTNSTIDYHDYNLSLYLYRKSFNINYYYNEILGTISYINFDFNKYKNIWVNRFSGYYGNFFEIMKTFIFCNGFTPKVFMFFQIIGLLIDFIYPSLSILVIYSIFYESFGESDILPSVFMTLLYIIIYLGSGTCSMISNKSEKIELTNYIFYIFMEIYYLFILICSVIAMDNIKKNKGYFIVEYKFNTAACSCLIIFTFIIGILPIIFKIKVVSKNISKMFIYLILGAPSSTSYFLISKIWRAPETSGGEYPEERKGLTIIFFFLFNLFFGFLNFYNFDRHLKVNCVMGLSIFYLIYLFFKIVAILISLLSGIEINRISDIKIINILSGLENNIYESNNPLAGSTDKLKEQNSKENIEEKLDKSNESKNEDNNNEENNESKDNNDNNDNNENQNDENFEIEKNEEIENKNDNDNDDNVDSVRQE